MNSDEAGLLFIVPTPIGNLGDITLRALETLSQVDFIACEDTRRSLKLLNHYGIRKPLYSYEKFSESRKTAHLIDKLKKGGRVALVSDGGTPLISDPGSRLVAEARANGIRITALPGACAFVTALSASGFEAPLRFIGFFPRKKAQAVSEIANMEVSNETTVFYESPKRLASTLRLFIEHLGDADMCVARELTKVYEEYAFGSPRELLANFESIEPKGEITVLVRTCKKPLGEPHDIRLRAKELLSQGCSKRDAAKMLQDLYGRPKKDIYTMLLEEIL